MFVVKLFSSVVRSFKFFEDRSIALLQVLNAEQEFQNILNVLTFCEKEVCIFRSAHRVVYLLGFFFGVFFGVFFFVCLFWVFL